MMGPLKHQSSGKRHPTTRSTSVSIASTRRESPPASKKSLPGSRPRVFKRRSQVDRSSLSRLSRLLRVPRLWKLSKESGGR